MMNLAKLKEPFPAEDIEWRVQRAGAKNNMPWAMVLAYVTNRAIMNRLDDVCGPENWRNEFKTGPDGGVLCGISIKVDQEWVTKWDGADKTQVEAVKGGLSGAMKRAAVQWGIGRYLYNLDATFAEISDNGKHFQPKDKGGKYEAFKWNPPVLPEWALPEGLATKEQQAKLVELGKESIDMTPEEVRALAAYYRAGDRLTKKEAQDLIDNFEARSADYIKATSKSDEAAHVGVESEVNNAS